MSDAVVVGIGQPAAGDDSVGLHVARLLATRGFEVRECVDASLLLDLCEAGRRIVLVDAVVGGGPPGTVLQLDAPALAAGVTALSSHGLGVAETLELARTLYGEPRIAIVGIAIDQPAVRSFALSPVIAAALAPAAALAAALARGAPGARVGAMHESTLARRILDLATARASGATIRVVRGRVAETETLSLEALELHFRAYARDTVAASAELRLELVHVEARCRRCAATYLPEHHVLLCPSCGSTDGEELGPTGLWIESIEVDAPP